MPSLPAVSNKASSRVEDELVLLCSRVKVDGGTTARIQAITRSAVDWDHVYQLALRHSVIPLVYSQLSTVAAVDVPPQQLARLKKNYQDNVARNLLLTAELCRILQTFQAARIDAVPWKGPALAQPDQTPQSLPMRALYLMTHGPWRVARTCQVARPWPDIGGNASRAATDQRG